MLLLSIFFFCITIVSANSHCRSNAILNWRIEETTGGFDRGIAGIVSGKDSQEIPTATAMGALSDCAFNNHACSGTWTGSYWDFSCITGGMRWSSGEGNVEFNCSDGPYTCYSFGSA